MPRKFEDLELRSIRLSNGASEKLKKFYPNVGYNRVIRVLVDAHIRLLEEAAAQRAISDIELDASRQAAKELLAEDASTNDDA